MEGHGEVLILSSNNYLGLANHPELIEAGKRALERYGAGTASVRFICGTFAPHRELEEALAAFLGTEAALSYVSCWNANTGILPLLAGEGDALICDELNHASIIDGARMSKAQRLVYRHADLNDLEKKLREARGASARLIATDGVFSMEGDLAPLSGQIDVLTGTLGKALGGAAGGFVAGSRQVVELATQSSRPQIFSNALPVTIAASALRAIQVLDAHPELVAHLHENARFLREGLRAQGFRPLEAPSAIIPILVGQTASAIRLSARLLERGVFVTGFGYPVVPEGKARLRVQASAALGRAEMERALEAFRGVRGELP
jgi:glycine C-acetyltransferase